MPSISLPGALLSLVGTTLAQPAPTPVSSDELVGWYERDGAAVCATWRVAGGVHLVDPVNRDLDALVPGAGGTLEVRSGSGSAAVVEIERLDTVPIVLRWSDAGGSPRSLRRLEHGPYTQAQSRFRNGDVELAATIMVPGDGPSPGVVIIQGSGGSSRDNQWALLIADHLARNGIAVLFPDKRGSGGSSGDWSTAGFDDLAQDAVEGMRVLRSMPGVDAHRTGFVGLSQGGWIAPLAAELIGDAAFVVSVSGTVVTPAEQVRHEVAQDFRNAGVAQPGIDRLLATVDAGLAYVRTGDGWDEYLSLLDGLKGDPALAPFAAGFKTSPDDPFWVFWRKVHGYDPVTIWARLRAPALLIYGERDEQDNVPVIETVRRIEAFRPTAASGDVTVRVFPGVGHALWDDGRGWVTTDALDLLAAWIKAHAD